MSIIIIQDVQPLYLHVFNKQNILYSNTDNNKRHPISQQNELLEQLLVI